jgi:hypothetical protein
LARGSQAVFVEHRAEILRLGIGDDRPLVAYRRQKPLDELGHAGGFGTRQLDDPVLRLRRRDLGQSGSHIVGRDRLELFRRHKDFAPLGGAVGDRLEKLEELRRAQQRVRHAAFDHAFLGAFCPQVAAVADTVRTDHRQRDIVRDARRRRGAQQVPGRGPEEIHDGTVLERRGVGHVDDDIGSGQRLPSPVRLFTPVEGAAATTWCPPASSLAASLRPIRPVPPMITTFIFYAPRNKTCRAGL